MAGSPDHYFQRGLASPTIPLLSTVMGHLLPLGLASGFRGVKKDKIWSMFLVL